MAYTFDPKNEIDYSGRVAINDYSGSQSNRPLPGRNSITNISQANRPLPGRNAIPVPSQPAPQRATSGGTSSQGPRQSDISNALSIYDSIKYPEAPRGPASITFGGETQSRFQPANDDSWRNRLYAERSATASRGSYSGAQAPAQRTIQPMQAIPTPDMPEYNAPAYAPPGEDPDAYSNARREAIAPGLRAMREGTREAISSAQSLDNPNARGLFIKQALRGYGQGLESVAAGAGKEARQVAGDKRREQLDTYRIQHSVQSDTYLQNYQNQINTIAADFAQQQAAATQNFNAQLDPSINIASSAPSGPRTAMEAGRALRQQFYPGA